MKELRKKFWLFFFAIALTGQSCSLTDNKKDTVVQVKDEFKINIIENLGSPRQLFFELESLEEQPCQNSSIDKYIVVGENKISLFIEDIQNNSDCNPGMTIAAGIANAGSLLNHPYDLLVSVRETVENEGSLFVTGKKYELSLFSDDGIQVEHAVLNKVPENFIWGYAAYDDETLGISTVANFIASLEEIAQAKQMDAGYYGHFTINENEEIEMRKQPAQNFSTPFFYEFTGSSIQLESILQQYRSLPESDQIEYAIFTSNGDVF
ncbi:MAG TPA: hypothetical protein ENJ95_08510 [Bacteroidetes bacterium]|nr:hypothetical protein [Bacteroidota bacterium]